MLLPRVGALIAARVGAATVNPAPLRPAVTLSGDGWKFVFDPQVAGGEVVQINFSDCDWQAVVVRQSFDGSSSALR